jgi:hypothetical protein
MPAPRLVEQGTGPYSKVQERIRYYKEKDKNEGTRHEVWSYRRGPGDYAYEVFKL